MTSRLQPLLLCRPQGGFNDMLSQIEKCCRYAERMHRVVVVDTAYTDHGSLGDDLSRYFASRQKKLLLTRRGLDQAFEQASVFPNSLQGRLNSYVAQWDSESLLFLDPQTGDPITFDFGKHYKEQILVHHQLGRFQFSRFALHRLVLLDAHLNELLARLRAMGGPYVGVHVRHTDYQSRYHELIEQFRQHKSAKRIFLATDNANVLHEFRQALGDEIVHSFASNLSMDGKPMHYRKLGLDQIFLRNRDTILDLLMLALSTGVIYSELTDNRDGYKMSGFTHLAVQLSHELRLVSLVLGDRVSLGLD